MFSSPIIKDSGGPCIALLVAVRQMLAYRYCTKFLDRKKQSSIVFTISNSADFDDWHRYIYGSLSFDSMKIKEKVVFNPHSH